MQLFVLGVVGKGNPSSPGKKEEVGYSCASLIVITYFYLEFHVSQ